MSEKFEYEEYEKLSDAVRDLENKEVSGVFEWNFMREEWEDCGGEFHITMKYAKRVEIKEKTVEATRT